MIIRSSRFKTALVAAVAVAVGAPMVACSSDTTADKPDGGGEEETGGKGSGGAGKGTGGATAGSTGTGGRTGTGGSNATGGSTGGAASGGRAGSGGSATGGRAGASTGGGTADSGTQADSGADGSDGGCVATESPTVPTVPDAIKPPAGTTLLHHFHAIGTQNYTCTETPGTGGADPTYGYGASTPEALLYDSCGKAVIHHYAGPTWEWIADASKVKGAKLAGVDNPGSIPLLLLKGTPQTATGELSAVSYIQRLDTTGGAAPAAATCTVAHVGEVTKVDYTANYYFYEGPPIVDSGRD